jgi:hypothetical protein
MFAQMAYDARTGNWHETKAIIVIILSVSAATIKLSNLGFSIAVTTVSLYLVIPVFNKQNSFIKEISKAFHVLQHCSNRVDCKKLYIVGLPFVSFLRWRMAF